MVIELTMPKLSPTMETGVIAKWHKKEGDKVESGDLILEISTDKATVEHNSLDEGFLRKILIQEGGEAAVNQPIALMTETADEKFDSSSPVPAQTKEKVETPEEAVKPETKTEVSQDSSSTRIKASPLAKKIAEQEGIDIGSLKGTGPGGRILSRDLKSGKKVTTESTPAGSFDEEPLTQMRKVIAQRLQSAKSSIPHIYVTIEIDAGPLVHFRDQLSKSDVKVSYNDLIVKAAALSLRSHPLVNSGFNEKKQTLIRFKTVDISIAVSIENGLITPIVTNADHKSITEISQEVKALANKAKENKLKPAEFQGGSFTVSNLGMFGVLEFAAIINPPQSCILAVGALMDRPVVKKGKVEPGKTMNLTLSADHRVVDGVLAAQYLQTLQKYLENPITLLIT